MDTQIEPVDPMEPPPSHQGAPPDEEASPPPAEATAEPAPDQPSPPGGPPIEILPGLTIPASLVQPHFDPRCRDCTAGVVTVVIQGGRQGRLCFCAVRRCRAKIKAARQQVAAQSRPAASAAPTDAALEREARRVTGLRAQLAEAQGEIADRQAEFDARRTAAEQAIADGARLEGMLTGVLDEAEVELAGLRSERDRLGEAITNLEERMKTARDQRSAIEGKLAAPRAALLGAQQTFDRSVVGLRAQVMRLERRISTAYRHTPELQPPAPPVSLEPAAPAAEPAATEAVTG